MSWTIDVSQPFLLPSELRRLAEAVYSQVSINDEGHWVEWKGPLDLATANALGKIARTILAFANRDPRAASSRAGGYGYLLVGVEPNNLAGVVEVDHQRLEGQIRSYVGSDVAWTPEYVSIQGKSVLIVVVSPPKAGDAIRVLCKTIEGYQAGAVFVRVGSITTLANPTQMEMLQRRLLSRTDVLTLELFLCRETIERSPDMVTFLDAWRKKNRTVLLARPRYEDHLHERSTLARLSGVSVIDESDNRTPVEYEAEVDKYVSEVTEILAARYASRRTEHLHMSVQLGVANNDDVHYEQVQLRVHVSGDRVSTSGLPREMRWLADVHLPAPPRRLGEPKMVGLVASFPDYLRVPALPAATSHVRHSPGFRVRNGHSVDIEYDEFNLRAGDRLALPAVPLNIESALGDVLHVEWSATAANLRGRPSGELRLTVVQSTFPVDSLLNKKGSRRDRIR